MLFGKNKKEQEFNQQKELEKISIEKERIKEEEYKLKLQSEKETAENKPAHPVDEIKEPPRKLSPYKFSVPDPMPKELVSVLSSMLKRLFPEATKAFLVLTTYENKKGYLLVVDIAPKYHKIISLYLDGETQKVRNGYPIECILYSKSGNLTKGMTPFYEKIVPEQPAQTSTASKEESTDIEDIAIPKFSSLAKEEPFTVTPIKTPSKDSSDVASSGGTDSSKSSPDDISKSEQKPGIRPAVSSDSSTDAQAGVKPDETPASKPMPELEIKKNTVKVVPETKQQLFALMNRAATETNAESVQMAADGFAEYKFYIPFITKTKMSASSPANEFPKDARLILLLNRDNGIKAATFFTDFEPARKFAKEKKCSLACISYKDYKAAHESGIVADPSAEGIIINPDAEQILLPADYPLL